MGITEGNITFRSTVIKPYLTLNGEPDNIELKTENTEKVLRTPQVIIPQDIIIVIKKVMDEIRKLRARRQVQNVLNTQNGPNTDAVHNLLLNLQVLI